MKGVLLLSTGIDSPVAGHLMKRKAELVCLHMQTGKETGDAKKAAKGLGLKLKIVDHRPFLRRARARCNKRYLCILCKREMYRQAEKLAEKEEAGFIVTGESLGQVASQTLDNLAALDSAVPVQVLRPLLGFDKDEIIGLAREIGSLPVKNEKCAYVPGNPLTTANIDKVTKEEAKLDG